MRKKSKTKRVRLVHPTAAEDAWINAGIAADPDTYELTEKDFAKLKPLSEVLAARMGAGLTQQKFAEVLGVSARTVQEWEQGRRKPSGAARSLLTIAKKRPEVLREVFGQ
jgi:putative transcriptional regulator